MQLTGEPEIIERRRFMSVNIDKWLSENKIPENEKIYDVVLRYISFSSLLDFLRYSKSSNMVCDKGECAETNRGMQAECYNIRQDLKKRLLIYNYNNWMECMGVHRDKAHYNTVQAFMDIDSEIVILEDMRMSVGRIAGDFWYERYALYREASEWWDFDESHDYIKIEKQKNRIEKIVQAAKRGGIIRIWAGNNAEDMSLFYMLMSLIEGSNCTVFLMSPNEINMSDRVKGIRVRAWEMLECGQMFDEIMNGSVLENEDICEYAEKWRELELKNDMIRIWKDGDVVSVPENYFDQYIFENIGTKPIRLRVVLGKCIDKLLDIDPDEYYLVDRIYYLIDNGSLEYVKEGEPLPPYDCYIRRK